MDLKSQEFLKKVSAMIVQKEIFQKQMLCFGIWPVAFRTFLSLGWFPRNCPSSREMVRHIAILISKLLF